MVLAFYQHADFVGERGAPVARPRPSGRANFAFPAQAYRARLMAYFSEVVFDRHGTLRGEYILLDNSLALISRDGEVIRINSCLEDVSAPAIAAFYASPGLQARIGTLLQQWDDLPLVQHLPCLTDAYFNNYYHFSLDLIPRLRFFEQSDIDVVGMPLACLDGQFQSSLLAQTMQGRTLLPLAEPIRVRHPCLAHGLMSQDAIGWLRRTVRAVTPSGGRRIYIRRRGSVTRTPAGGGIVESREFLAFLSRFGFETVDFGLGATGVHEQVTMLKNAGVVLAAHGAALTNLAYLNPPLTVIEIFGTQTVWAGFLHLADGLSFDYHGILFEATDEHNDILVDCATLSDVMRNI